MQVYDYILLGLVVMAVVAVAVLAWSDNDDDGYGW